MGKVSTVIDPKRLALIKRIMGDSTDSVDQIAERVNAALEEQERIRQERRSLDAAAEQVRRDCDAKLALIGRHLADLHLSCPHYATTYHGDPSGGRDSYTHCDDCGADL